MADENATPSVGPPSGKRLPDRLRGSLGGTYFSRDLEEARELARSDARFEELVLGLATTSLGERLEAVSQFFSSFDPEELSTLELPQNLSQLRAIFLMSR